MSSTKSLVAYHERMEHNNSLNDNSSRLSYETYQEQAIHVSKMADSFNNILNKCVPIECPTLSPSHGQTTHPALGSLHVEDIVININLPYNPNASMEPELWDRNFYSILLHGLMEHLASDSKNIKDSLNFIAKYISNNQVNSLKTNDLEDFHVSQTSFSLYLHNQWSNIHKLSSAGKLQMRAICTYAGCIKATTNN